MKRSLGVLLTLMALTLVACGGQPPLDPDPDPDPEPADTVTATVNPQTDMQPVLGAAFVMVDPEAAFVLTGAAVVEADEGVYIGPYSEVGADGQVELILPDAAEIPAEVLAPAGEFYYGIDYGTCELTTSAADVNVSQFSGETEFFTFPGVMTFMLDANAPALVTAAPVDMTLPDPGDVEPITWLYADGAVDIATPAAGCMGEIVTYHFDLSLEQGWNQVAISIERDPVSGAPVEATITNGESETLYLNTVVAF